MIQGMRRLAFAAGALATLLGSPAGAQDELDTILSCMRANIPRSVLIKDVELTATDRVGSTRVLKGRLYGQREEERLRTALKISAPSDLAGAAYLLRESGNGDEMYMYVPALQRVRRISGTGSDGALWGTDLSYGDIKQINNAFSAGGGKVDGQGELDGRPVHLLSLSPDPAEETRYTAMKVWVDRKTCVSLRADFYEGSNVRKQWTVVPSSLTQAGKHWYAGDSTMTDLVEKTHTRLRVLGLDSDVDLAGRHFNPKTFYLGS
jgi:hypothetical protein